MLMLPKLYKFNNCFIGTFTLSQSVPGISQIALQLCLDCLGPLCTFHKENKREYSSFKMITVATKNFILNRLLFKNGILNIRKHLGMTKDRPHRTKYI